MDDPNKLIQQQFGANAAKYATSAIHAQGKSLARLVELAYPQRDWLVLDVSTGAGHTAFTFAPHVTGVIAVDLTPQMLDTARQLAKERGITNIEFGSADVQALPFKDNTFDLVTNRIALHHYADARQAIAEMARVCKPDGVVAFTDNIVPPDKGTAGYINHLEQLRDRAHRWAYPAVRLQALFTDVGLKVEHTESITKELELDPWADRMGAGAELKATLRRWLDDAPDPARAWLTPRQEGDRMFFTLHEAIIVARKG
jgi:ubiquinone/menaquinone biosynthesis C-methylase UbiE